MHIARPGAVWCGIAGIAPAAFLMPFTLLIGTVKWGPMPVGVLGAAGFLGLCLACMNGHRQRGLLWNSVAAVLLCFGLSLALPWLQEWYSRRSTINSTGETPGWCWSLLGHVLLPCTTYYGLVLR